MADIVSRSAMAQDPRGRGELRQEMLELMAEQAREAAQAARDGNPRQRQTAVHGAAKVIEAIDREQAPEQMLIDLMGSPEKALEWMQRMIPRLQAMVVAKRLGGGQ